MWIILFFLISFSVLAGPKTHLPPVWLPDNFWNRVQIMDMQSRQQLQAQDQYRRMLLLQDQQWQIQRMQDEQRDLDDLTRSLQMRQHVDRLKMYSRSAKPKPQGMDQPKSKNRQ